MSRLTWTERNLAFGQACAQTTAVRHMESEQGAAVALIECDGAGMCSMSVAAANFIHLSSC